MSALPKRWVRALLFQAALWAPTMGEKDAISPDPHTQRGRFHPESDQWRSSRRVVPASAVACSQSRRQNQSQVSGSGDSGEKQFVDLRRGKSRKERTKRLAAKDEKEEPPPEARPVLPRGSMIKENLTRLAAIETRSQGLQTASPTATRSVTTQTTCFTMDMGSLQQTRPIQRAYRMELQKARASHHSHHRIDKRPKSEGARAICHHPSLKVARPNQVHYAGYARLEQKQQCGSGGWFRTGGFA